MRAVQWPIPGILKAPDPAEELERGVKAGTRSKRSPTPFRNWTVNADRGCAGGKEQVARDPWNDCDNSLTTTNTHIHTSLCLLLAHSAAPAWSPSSWARSSPICLHKGSLFLLSFTCSLAHWSCLLGFIQILESTFVSWWCSFTSL